MADIKRLGSSIQHFRKIKGLTQDDLSDRARIAYSTLAKIERGAIKNPSVFTVHNLAQGLGLSVEELITGVKEPSLPVTEKDQAIKFIYFDVNGVLVRFYQRGFVSLAKECNVPVEKVENSFWHYNDAVNRGDISEEKFDRLLALNLGVKKKISWKEHYLKAAQPIKEMHSVAKKLAKEYPVGLLTNIFPGFLESMIEAKKLPNIKYKTIIDSSEVKSIKPEPKIFQIAEDRCGYTGTDIMFIDDSRTNLIAAEKLGWNVMWFDDYRPEESAKRVSAVFKI